MSVQFLFVGHLNQFITRHRADGCPLSSKMQRMKKTFFYYYKHVYNCKKNDRIEYL